MGWFKWILGAIVALFVYFGASQLMNSVVTGTSNSDQFAREIVPLVLALVGIALPVMILGRK